MLGPPAEAKLTQSVKKSGGRHKLLRVTRSNPVKLHFRKNFREKIPLVPHSGCPAPRPKVLDAGEWRLVSQENAKISCRQEKVASFGESFGDIVGD